MSITIKHSTDISFEMTNSNSSSEIDIISKNNCHRNIVPPHLISAVLKSTMVLPQCYQPSNYDVICGRGRGHFNQPGNIRFRALISSRLNEYQSLKNKIDKSIFFNKILDEVRTQNDGNAYFIRQASSDATWEIVSDDQAREKIGHAIREALLPRNKQSKSQEVISDTCLSLSRSITPTASASSSSTSISDTKSGILAEYPSTELIRQSTDQIVFNLIEIFENEEKFDIVPDKATSSSSSTTMRGTKTCETKSLLHTNTVSESISTNNIDTANISNVNNSCLSLDGYINVTTTVTGDNSNTVSSSICSPNCSSNSNDAWIEYQINKKETKKLDLLLDDCGDNDNYLKSNKYYYPDMMNKYDEEEKVDDIDDDDNDDICRRMSGISITCGLKYHSVSVSLAEEFCKINRNYSDMIQNNKQKDYDDDDEDDKVCRRLSGLSFINSLNISMNMSLSDLLE